MGVEKGFSEETNAKGEGGLLRPGAAFPLQSGAGGDFATWVRRMHEEDGDPLSEAEEPMRWLLAICKEGRRVDRLVGGLVRIERSVQGELREQRAAADRCRAEVAALLKENRLARRMLEARDRQLALMQSEIMAARVNWVWRLARGVCCASRAVRRLLGMAAATRGVS